MSTEKPTIFLFEHPGADSRFTEVAMEGAQEAGLRSHISFNADEVSSAIAGEQKPAGLVISLGPAVISGHSPIPAERLLVEARTLRIPTALISARRNMGNVFRPSSQDVILPAWRPKQPRDIELGLGEWLLGLAAQEPLSRRNYRSSRSA